MGFEHHTYKGFFFPTTFCKMISVMFLYSDVLKGKSLNLNTNFLINNFVLQIFFLMKVNWAVLISSWEGFQLTETSLLWWSCLTFTPAVYAYHRYIMICFSLYTLEFLNFYTSAVNFLYHRALTHTYI